MKPSWPRVETKQQMRVMLRHMVPNKSWTLMMAHWKVKILTTVNNVSLTWLNGLTTCQKKVKNGKKHRSESIDETVPETWNAQWLVARVTWAVSWPLNSGNQFHSWSKVQWKYESDYVYRPVIWKWLHRAFHDCLPQNC